MRKSIDQINNEFYSIKMNTINSFQGGEADIILISIVIDNLNQFINDTHRTNVLFSKAKYGMLMKM